MSGPVSSSDEAPSTVVDEPVACEMEVSEGRKAEVGGFEVRRVLPRQKRRTVGAWCFVDQMGPAYVSRARAMEVGPHPHIGLQTVTWLLSGEGVHHDSLGSEQLIRPGQLNLMTAGRGVVHAEESTGKYDGEMHGVQLWIAQPSETRDGDAAFEHHPQLPQFEASNAIGTVIVGSFADVSSAARRDTEHVGVELELRKGRTVVPLDRSYEHALVGLDGAIDVGDKHLEPGQLGYLGVGRDELAIDVRESARVLLIGGAPFDEQLVMWWNYVARTRDEIISAHQSWMSEDERFGDVESRLSRITTSGPPWSS